MGTGLNLRVVGGERLTICLKLATPVTVLLALLSAIPGLVGFKPYSDTGCNPKLRAIDRPVRASAYNRGELKENPRYVWPYGFHSFVVIVFRFCMSS
jgi:hypothetical protein